jgi:diamine N-acetyltransferase
MQFIKIAKENFFQAIQLKPKSSQTRFMRREAVLYSLAQAYITADQPDRRLPLVIEHEGQLVGSIRLRNYGRGVGFAAFFIDGKHQGRGLGRAALLHLFEYVKTHYPRATEIETCVHPDNTIARKLYESLGFAYTGACTGEYLDMETQL